MYEVNILAAAGLARLRREYPVPTVQLVEHQFTNVTGSNPRRNRVMLLKPLNHAVQSPCGLLNVRDNGDRLPLSQCGVSVIPGCDQRRRPNASRLQNNSADLAGLGKLLLQRLMDNLLRRVQPERHKLLLLVPDPQTLLVEKQRIPHAALQYGYLISLSQHRLLRFPALRR